MVGQILMDAERIPEARTWLEAGVALASAEATCTRSVSWTRARQLLSMYAVLVLGLSYDLLLSEQAI